MIPEETIRQEHWSAVEDRMDNLLGEIPMTTPQRRDIQGLMHELRSIFYQANS